MFLILKTTYFTGYVDDNTSFVVRDSITNIIKFLEEIVKNLNLLKIGDLHINNSLS